MKYLGVDYGTRRIGLALSDDTSSLAFPYKTLQTSKNTVNEILTVIKEKEVTCVVLGESKNLDMKDNPVMEHIKILKNELEKKGVVVEYHPEFYSSAQVFSIMGEQNKAIDASAAAIILQNYLDLQKNI